MDQQQLEVVWGTYESKVSLLHLDSDCNEEIFKYTFLKEIDILVSKM